MADLDQEGGGNGVCTVGMGRATWTMLALKGTAWDRDRTDR